MTGVSIPSGWKWTTLLNVAAPEPYSLVDGPFGSNLKLTDYVEQGIPVLQGKNITNDRFAYRDVRYITEQKAQELRRSSVRIGDILIVKIGSIGYSAPITELGGHEYAIIPANLAKITPNSAVIDTGFLHYWLRSPMAKKQMMAFTSQTGQPAISLKKLATLPVPAVPLSEQKRIVEILNEQMAAVDKARAAAEAQLEAAKALPSAYLREVFPKGEPGKAPLPDGWRWEEIHKVGEVVTGGTPPRAESAYFVGSYPWIKPEDLDGRAYVELSAETLSDKGASKVGILPKGSVLVSCIGKIGKTAIALKDLCTNQQINSIVLKPGFSSEFVLLALKHMGRILSARSSVSLVPILNKTAFSAIPLPIPDLEEQERIASRLMHLLLQQHYLEVQLENQASTLRSLPAALLRQAFSGAL